MTKKYLFKSVHSSYATESECINRHNILWALKESLYIISRGYFFRKMPQLDDLNYPGIEFYYDKSRDEVNICHVGSIKKKTDITEMSDEEYDIYWDRYEEYYDKRYAELPKLVMMGWHWQDLEKRWKELLEQKPKYMIMELEDEVPPQKIKMIGKDELSAEDTQYFQKEREQYLKYQKAHEMYRKNHPDYSYDLWRGPQDDEYEADIMKYFKK